MLKKVLNPHLYQFSYSTRNVFNHSDEDSIRKAHNAFWKKLLGVRKLSITDENKQLHQNDYTPLFYVRDRSIFEKFSDVLSIYSVPNNESRHISMGGYYLPVCFSDSYGLQITSYLEDDSSEVDASIFYNMHQHERFKAGLGESDIGCTYLLSCVIDPQAVEKHFEDMATTIFEQFVGQTTVSKDSRRIFKQMKCLDGYLFEFFDFSTVKSSFNDECNHILVLILKSETAMEKVAKLSEYWLAIFYYRSKIIWAFRNFSKLKFQDPESHAKLPKLDLASIEEDVLGTYQAIKILSKDIPSLEFQLHTIEINLRAYKEMLVRLKKEIQFQEIIMSGIFVESDFFEGFINLTEKYFQEKVLDSLKFRRSALQRCQFRFETVKAMLEVKRADVESKKQKDDQKFNEFIQTWGIGIAAASLFSSIFIPFSQATPKNFSELFLSLKNSLIPGLIYIVFLTIISSLTAIIAKKLISQKKK